ncbi:tRNA (adenosine(37)-N6)-threonylcarbamoyltransferase complex dimerization subunit type 1 TsaB [Pseudorhodoferax sp.]|uniref:tRNA (adenosine(37)-N6)-threonylcarbamoyltransferase complex dimerization subunit type 1 TsaB n=1 Tax=Pseudorhodoferax sp. TaxID=1993553 RepID=UPI002DD65331|nr:tRNA (adenosine(37)-N6)-threonylcarbamoyltransferase complex dimerization subunit type 1 TsaB [Pseudorhodoferax sp.]
MPLPPPSSTSSAVPLLALDTSTERLAIALQAGGRGWVANGEGGAAASAALLPAVEALLAEAGCALKSLAAIAFGRGPGAFTGLRTSCAVAQGLAFGLGVPVLPIDSLLIVAEQACRAQAVPEPVLDVGVVMDARMGEVYAGRYIRRDGRWAEVQAPGLWDPAALDAAWAASPPAISAGSALAVLGDALRAACPVGGRRVVDDDRATALGALALQAWAAGAAVDAARALPLYLRDKVAQTTAERQAARAAMAT